MFFVLYSLYYLDVNMLVVLILYILNAGQICTKSTDIMFSFTAKILYRKIETYIPRKETARPQSQFLHSCFCGRFIYSHDRSAYYAAGKQVDRSWEYINRSQTHEFCFIMNPVSGNNLIIFWRDWVTWWNLNILTKTDTIGLKRSLYCTDFLN
jgi:hypothetical protein